MAKKIKDEEFSGFVQNSANKGSLKVGGKVPNFKAASTGDKPFQLKDYAGQNVIVYFYPKDHTSGCTQEGIDFSENIKKFKNQDCQIFGVSRESLDSHKKFIEKQNFKFELLSVPQEVICKFFDVIKEKSMYGKKYMGVERSTFVIGKEGKLLKEWRKVKVPGHAQEVLEFVKSL